MPLDRRTLISSLGLAAAGSVVPGLAQGKDPAKVCVTPGYIPKECRPNPNAWTLLYPKPVDFKTGYEAVAANFKRGLAWAFDHSATSESAEGAKFAEKVHAAVFKKSTEASYLDRFNDMIDDPQTHENVLVSDKKLWVTLNDHAFILGQICVAMGLSPKNEFSHRDFLRAQARHAQVVSHIYCACVFGEDAFAVPVYPPDVSKVANHWLAPWPADNLDLKGKEKTVKATPGQIDEDCPLC